MATLDPVGSADVLAWMLELTLGLSVEDAETLIDSVGAADLLSKRDSVGFVVKLRVGLAVLDARPDTDGLGLGLREWGADFEALLTALGDLLASPVRV